MNEILNDVYGQCLQVDHPSQMMDTLEGMRYVSHISQISKENRKERPHTLMILIVSSSRLATFALTDATMYDFLGMSLS